MSAMTYPTLMCTDNGYAALMQGHNLDPAEIAAVEESHLGKPDDGWFTKVEEVFYDWVPRLKWCSRHPQSGGWGCDQEGEWHGHWFEVLPTEIESCHFTLITHTDVNPDTGPEGER